MIAYIIIMVFNKKIISVFSNHIYETYIYVCLPNVIYFIILLVKVKVNNTKE